MPWVYHAGFYYQTSFNPEYPIESLFQCLGVPEVRPSIGQPPQYLQDKISFSLGTSPRPPQTLCTSYFSYSANSYLICTCANNDFAVCCLYLPISWPSYLVPHKNPCLLISNRHPPPVSSNKGYMVNYASMLYVSWSALWKNSALRAKTVNCRSIVTFRGLCRIKIRPGTSHGALACAIRAYYLSPHRAF